MDFFRDEPKEKLMINDKSVIEKTGYVMAALILMLVVVVMTSDIKINFYQSMAEMSAVFFILMILSYGMYVDMYSSGSLAGERADDFKAAAEAYENVIKDISVDGLQKRLNDFCREYIDNELRARREDVLRSAGVTWEVYEEHKNDSRRKIKGALSKIEYKAILRARRIKPIKLTPEKIYNKVRSASRRRGMRIDPHVRKRFDMTLQLVKSLLKMLCVGVIVFDAMSTMSWQSVGSVCLKIGAVATTGYSGYRAGYRNITVDTVGYMYDQINLLEQFKASEVKKNAEEQQS